MKVNMFMDIEGPAGCCKDVPNSNNPLEADSLQEVLNNLRLPERVLGVPIKITKVVLECARSEST